ncbi:MAG: hypothetical protein HN742_14295 [Lentisphaerae bacterium]|jgi:hypothetical protein|nr:hypothetical protein [Lentisphaerota bacterium]MBT4823258.1 hypothetical protein [Lentisphaerota bacterium]MBT5606639.1 hypothetical protein [Lentisphaerota bacterium]MBT7059518.1 hypothetical protein [Lentisphaerota bacterium]MBT7843045.1 hypothetical protein [Lentisphaerota bacterium]
MTWRAILIGLLSSVFLCAITYFNQSIMRQSAIVGNYIPLSVYGTLIFVVALLNPMLSRIRPSWRLKGRELAVILTLVLAACGLAESGFMKTFTNVVMLPRHYRRTTPAWDYGDTGTFSRLPSHMLADTGPSDEALNGFIQGKIGSEAMSLSNIPWDAWAAPLLTWLPLALLMTTGFIGLALVVHRQWSEHEKLPYPIAQFASSLLGRDDEGSGSVMHQRAFWVSAAVVLGIHLVNFAHSWWPQYMVGVSTNFDLRPLNSIMPTFRQGRLSWSILYCRLYFSVVGVAFLVSRDVSFSFAFIPIIGTYIQGLLAVYGVSFMGGGEHRASIYTSLNIGSFVAFLLMIPYFGRRFYWAVLRRAVGLPVTEDIQPHEVWGARVFMGSTLVCTSVMTLYGLAWPFAIAYMFMIIAFYVCVSRVVAQTGLFIMKPAWVPHILLLGLFGGYALGPSAALISMMFSAVFFAEARETVMPYMVNSLSLLEREGEGDKFGRIASWSVVAATIGLLIGLTTVLFLQYDHGTDMAAGGWFTRTVPTYPFELSTDIAQRLKGQGMLEASDALSPVGRILAMRPEPTFAVSFVIGALLVVGCYVGRLRIKGWPIHPAVFLLWSWSHCAKLTFSFFLGWAIKTAVTRYGGWRMVQKVRPVMIGLIAGDMLGAFVPAMISAIYYFVTGDPPQSYNIMP